MRQLYYTTLPFVVRIVCRSGEHTLVLLCCNVVCFQKIIVNNEAVVHKCLHFCAGQLQRVLLSTLTEILLPVVMLSSVSVDPKVRLNYFHVSHSCHEALSADKIYQTYLHYISPDYY